MAKKQLSEKDMEVITLNTAEELKNQEKVEIRLHLPADQKQKLEAAIEQGKEVQWPYQVVAINGYVYQIQLGKKVQVPKSVAEVLEQAGLI
jgi:hypothetical protein